MSTINITNARQKLFQLVADVNVGYNPITIVNNKGKNAVLISEDEWKNIEETLPRRGSLHVLCLGTLWPHDAGAAAVRCRHKKRTQGCCASVPELQAS